jgi:hypothetical protein|tara:strand:- start:1090 stop:1293 length:204 start_codon:yes stop_codon:yes gene_type:complete
MGIRKVETEVKDYIRHYVNDIKNGHEIVIVSGELHNEKVMKIKCEWPNRTRDDSGRVSSVKIKNFSA